MPEKLNRLEEKLISTKEQLENAKEELKKPFEKADELKTKVLRLAELNKLLDMGEVEEKRNDNPLVEDVKRAIIDFCNREYEENHSYEEFNTLYPDLKHIGIAYTNTPDERHGIQYELDLEEKTWTQYIDDTPIKTESFDYENKGENEALRNMKNEIEMSSFSDLVYVDSEDLRAATGLDIDDEGNFYDPLSKDLDNDGIPDRYDNDFKDSDYFESTYDVEDNFHNKEETAQKSENKDKMSKPSYNSIKNDEIDEIEIDGGKIRLLAGNYGEYQGYKGDYLPMDYYDIHLNANSEITLTMGEKDSVMIFTLLGNVYINDEHIEEKTAVKLTEGDSLTIKNGEQNAQVLYINSRALNEPVAWAGPIVMNTQEEVQKAFIELRNNTFIKEKVEY